MYVGIPANAVCHTLVTVKSITIVHQPPTNYPFSQMGLVCFRLVGGKEESGEQVDELNKKLLTTINASGKIHMVPASVRDRYVIRFCVVAQHATREDIGMLLEVIRILNVLLTRRSPVKHLLDPYCIQVTSKLQI